MTEAAGPEVTTTELAGLSWTLHEVGSGRNWPAEVPGSVHTALFAAGVIPDPFYRDNELAQRWIADRDWTYTCRLVPPRVLDKPHQSIVFHSLDTLATVLLDGDVVLEADNAHRPWEVDVSGRLAGESMLEVRLRSPAAALAAAEAEEPLPGWYGMVSHRGIGRLRKPLSNFGWDWAPPLVTCGVGAVELISWSVARITSVHVRQRHGGDQAELTVHTDVVGSSAGLQLTVDVRLAGRSLHTAAAAPGSPVRLRVDEPQLWWPNGIGSQPLYEVVVSLLQDGHLLDVHSQRIGLRTLELDRSADDDGETFRFACNGVRFFAGGANWIPPDAVSGRDAREAIGRSLRAAADAGFTMLRVWGGGSYEQDLFYDLCDELGICVWQDFAFACVTFPDSQEYRESVRAEAVAQVRRLRRHPSIALWCGNNELEMGLVGDGWTDGHMDWRPYRRVMDALLPAVVEEHDGERAYWPASPHTPGDRRADSNDPSAGDAHLWGVWHGGRPFEWFRESKHRFVSEFGFQSFPHPRTLDAVTSPEDRDLNSYVMDLRQKATAAGSTGTAELARQLTHHFRSPRDFEATIWQSQMLQAEALTVGLEHWRRSPTTGGALYWQLNDAWPGPSWSTVDYAGRWKAGHYAARRALARQLLSLVEDRQRQAVSVWLTNDGPEPLAGEVVWQATTCAGQVLGEGRLAATVRPGSSAVIGEVDLAPHVRVSGLRDVLFWASRAGSDDHRLATLVPVKHLHLVDPGLRLTRTGEELRVDVEGPALWVHVDDGSPGPIADDNFFHMPGGSRRLTLGAGRDALVCRSLVDTYHRPARPGREPGRSTGKRGQGTTWT